MATADLQSSGLKTSDALDASLALEEAAALLDLEPWIVDRLRHPIEVSTAYVQLSLDSGDRVCIPLLRVQHDLTFDSIIGSLDLLPDIDLGQCEAIAMERTWQAALLELPYGGSSYAAVADPGVLSERELTSLLRLCARQWTTSPSTRSVLLPGRGCRRELMPTLFSESKANSDLTVTGKPDCLGGIDLDLFVAEGIAAIAAATFALAGKPARQPKIAIQGFGSLGRTISRRLAGAGSKIVAISDTSGALFRSDGFIIEDVCNHHRRADVLSGYAHAESISRAQLLQVDADILVLTSGANEIHSRNWNTLAAKVIIEADRHAMSGTARANLANNAAIVVPWMLSTSGALAGAHLEACGGQVLHNAEESLMLTRHSIERAINKVVICAAENLLSVANAARQIAIERVANYVRQCRA